MAHRLDADGTVFDPETIALRGYWLKQVSRHAERGTLRLDYPRPVEPGRESGVVPVDITGVLHEKLSRLVGDSAFLLYATLLASLKACLYRYTDSTTIIVGSPLRVSAAADDAPNVLPIVDDVTGALSFRQLLVNVRETLVGAYERQRYPFDRLVRDLGLGQVGRRCPLFDVAMVLTDIHAPLPALANDLTFVFARQAARVSGHIAYDSALFDVATVERLAGHFLALLDDGLSDPNRSLPDLQMVTPVERHRLLVEWNQSRTDDVPMQCVHELVAIRAAQAPDAVAVACGGASLTYGELNARANQLARYLRGLQVGPETLVGVCVERSLDMIVGLLGVLKAGAAYVPLDPTYPPERLSFMMSEGPVSVLLSQARLASTVPAHDAQVVCLDAEWDRIGRLPTADPAWRVGAGNAAYVIYTSGSTGRPKGVVISHGSLRNLVAWHQRAFSVTARDRASQVAGTGFDASVQEIWAHLAAGASVHLIDDQARDSVEQIQEWLVAHRITITFLPTPLAERMLPLNWPEGACLRLMLVGGDKLHQYPTRPLPFGLSNGYGPTENTVVSTSGPVVGYQATPPPIGRPIANVEVYILDRHLKPVPVGVPGHLHVSGAGVARGYLKRPGLTAEQFIPNPFGSGRLYRTGDTACYRSDGRIEFLGRLDQQVKIRGFRIELGEIEAVLLEHADVRDAVVVAHEVQTTGAASTERQLVAYVVSDWGSGSRAREQWSPETLRAFLLEKLPEYMVPTAFVPLTTLPLTAHGKVDRAALPAPTAAQRTGTADYQMPRTETERELAAVWIDVLRRTAGWARRQFLCPGRALPAGDEAGVETAPIVGPDGAAAGVVSCPDGGGARRGRGSAPCRDGGAAVRGAAPRAGGAGGAAAAVECAGALVVPGAPRGGRQSLQHSAGGSDPGAAGCCGPGGELPGAGRAARESANDVCAGGGRRRRGADRWRGTRHAVANRSGWRRGGRAGDRGSAAGGRGRASPVRSHP